MRILITFPVLAMLGGPAAAGQAGSYNVYVDGADMAEFDEHSVWDPVDATDSLVASIHKSADGLRVVDDLDQACFTIESKARARRKASAYVSVNVVGSDGATVLLDEADRSAWLQQTMRNRRTGVPAMF